MSELSQLDRWLIFNIGCFELLEYDFAICELDWIAKFNSNWHDSDLRIIRERLSRLGELGFIEKEKKSNAYFHLAKLGIEEWKRIAEPDFAKAFEWSCAEPELVGFDFRISIAAPKWDRVFAVFARALNDGFFSLVASENVTFDENCSFYPLYWYESKGVRICFDAANTEQSISKVNRYAELFQHRDKGWFKQI